MAFEDILAAAQAHASAEYTAAVDAFHEAQVSQLISERADLVKYAMIFCRCSRVSGFTNPDVMFPQAECMVHGQLAMLPDGRLLP